MSAYAFVTASSNDGLFGSSSSILSQFTKATSVGGSIFNQSAQPRLHEQQHKLPRQQQQQQQQQAYQLREEDSTQPTFQVREGSHARQLSFPMQQFQWEQQQVAEPPPPAYYRQQQQVPLHQRISASGTSTDQFQVGVVNFALQEEAAQPHHLGGAPEVSAQNGRPLWFNHSAPAAETAFRAPPTATSRFNFDL